ncbi:MAG: septum formation inhibitor Maf [Desulfobacteraceae bacterium]|nr:septum formation inhibitor Maf [Desulfobacteraceae bacterium]
MNQLNKIIQKPMILASKSPRRKELLGQTGLCFKTLAADIDEKSFPLENPKDYVRSLSQIKADHIAKIYPDHWVIGADTIVVVDDLILGKPRTQDDAIHMLNTLNNRQHCVFTGFTICCHAKKESITKSIETKVFFKQLSQSQIQWYAATDEPYDKAGGYGIQGIGAFLVRKINGSYSNVVGLPVCEVMETLLTLGIIQFQGKQK